MPANDRIVLEENLEQSRESVAAELPGSIHDPPCAPCVATAEVCGIPPRAPIGGCDPPHPASKDEAAPKLSTKRANLLINNPSDS